MAQKTNRTQIINLRATPAEKALIREQAGGPREIGAYLRRLAREDAGKPRPAVRPENGYVAPENQARIDGPDHEQRVKVMALRMPRRTAENLVRKEEARERARAPR